MSQLFKNAARAAVAAPIAAADTSLTVDITKADLFPAANTGTDPVNTTGKDWYKVVLEDVNHNIEIAYVRTRTLGSAVMSNMLRGQEGTTALSFATGSIVGLRLTALDLQDAIDLAAQATTPGQDVLWAATVDAQVQALGTGLQKQIATAFTTTGTSTAYLLTPTPAITAYVANLSFDVTFDEVCGDDPTLQISGVATPPNLVKQLTDGSYANIKAGDIPANHRSRVTLLSPTQAWVESLPNLFRIGAGADIASAATLDLTARDGNVINITGTTPTSAFTIEDGGRAELIAPAGWQLTYNATTNPVQGGRTYICEAGDRVVVSANGSSVLNVQVIRGCGNTVVEVGDVVMVPSSSARPGTVKLNGSLLNRTNYPNLYAYAVASGNIEADDATWSTNRTTNGTNGKFSPGDGSTTFRLPDVRGDFLRFWSDGSTVDSGRAIGSAQADSFKSHRHNAYNSSAIGWGGTAGIRGLTNGNYNGTDTGDQLEGGTETRPRNSALLACIKY